LGEASSKDPVIACTPNGDYALGAAVTLHSAARNLDPARRLRVFLVDGGLGPWTRRQLLRSLDPARIDLTLVRPEFELLRDLPVQDYQRSVIYLRLLLPSLLPATVEKVIYLDADLAIHGDLGEIWDLDLDGNLALGVQDVGCPFIDAERALPDFETHAPHLWSVRGVENWEELGLDPAAKYFNAGLLVLDLAGWRREGMTDRMLRCLRENHAYAGLADQYALNVCLAGRFGELDLSWNVPLAIHRFPSPEASPFDAETVRGAIESPNVVHYTGFAKPWLRGHRGIYHPWSASFQMYLEELDWPAWKRLRWTLYPVVRERARRRWRRVLKATSRGANRLRRAARKGARRMRA
jgi:lipopolysaccharide biosynthesis glycosyltransferase